MATSDIYESAIQEVLNSRGVLLNKLHVDIARLNALNLRRAEFVPPDKNWHLEATKRVFSPAQTDYISPRIRSEFASLRVLFSELAEEYQINTENSAGRGMYKMRNISISEASDLEYVSAEEIMQIVDDRDFVAECFKKIFRRDPDRPGFDHYLYVLQSGYMTRRQIISDMWHSEEGRRQYVLIYDRLPCVPDHSVSNETIHESTNIPLFINENAFKIPGFRVFVKDSNDEKLISSVKNEFILHGPKCLIEKGSYFIDIDLEIKEGLYVVEATAFAGKIVLFSLPVRNKLIGEIGFNIEVPMDLFEIRIQSFGDDLNRIKINHMILRGRH